MATQYERCFIKEGIFSDGTDRQRSRTAKIGLWGISRVGWINPIVINKYEDIQFWISVSGVEDKENFKYLLKQNMKINGHPKDSVDLILDQWLEDCNHNLFQCETGGFYELQDNNFPYRRFDGFLDAMIN